MPTIDKKPEDVSSADPWRCVHLMLIKTDAAFLRILQDDDRHLLSLRKSLEGIVPAKRNEKMISDLESEIQVLKSRWLNVSYTNSLEEKKVDSFLGEYEKVVKGLIRIRNQNLDTSARISTVSSTKGLCCFAATAIVTGVLRPVRVQPEGTVRGAALYISEVGSLSDYARPVVEGVKGYILETLNISEECLEQANKSRSKKDASSFVYTREYVGNVIAEIGYHIAKICMLSAKNNALQGRKKNSLRGELFATLDSLCSLTESLVQLDQIIRENSRK